MRDRTNRHAWSKGWTSQPTHIYFDEVALLKIRRLTVSFGKSDNTPLVDRASRACLSCFGLSVGMGVGARSTEPRNWGEGRKEVMKLGREPRIMR